LRHGGFMVWGGRGVVGLNGKGLEMKRKVGMEGGDEKDGVSYEDERINWVLVS